MTPPDLPDPPPPNITMGGDTRPTRYATSSAGSPPPGKGSGLVKLIVAFGVLAFVAIGACVAIADRSGVDELSGNDLCLEVSPSMVSMISEGLVDSTSLSSAAAVRSGDFEQVWFVAAEIEGPGVEGPGEVGVWATNVDPGGVASSGTIYAVDGFANEFSDWADGSSTDAGMSLSDDGASEAQECVG